LELEILNLSLFDSDDDFNLDNDRNDLKELLGCILNGHIGNYLEITINTKKFLFQGASLFMLNVSLLIMNCYCTYYVFNTFVNELLMLMCMNVFLVGIKS